MAEAQKHFKKRDAILQYLRMTDTHPSAEMVYGALKPRMPDLSLATVYRNLSLFRTNGQIISVGTVNGTERFDGNTVPHVHFVCTDCCCVTDMHRIKVPEEVSGRACQLYGCEVADCQLTITGICEKCLAKRKAGETA